MFLVLSDQSIFINSIKKGNIKLHISNESKNRGPPPPISYKANHTIIKTSTDKTEVLKVNIKTQPDDKDSKTVAIYIPLFRNRSP